HVARRPTRRGLARHWPPQRDVIPKLLAPDRVEDEVDALIVIIVDDAVQPPGVENPAFAGGHVHDRIAALEADAGLRHHWNVHAHPVDPVIALVGVLRDFRVAREPHQPRAANRDANRGHRLLYIRAAFEVRCGAHWAREALIGRIAV